MNKVVTAAIALVLLSVPAVADPGGKAVGEDAGALIAPAERAMIQAYYRGHPEKLPSGAGLPSSARDNIARGKRLPPGIGDRMPEQLAVRLARHPGYAYQVVGGNVLLVEIATGTIADMLPGAPR